MHPRTTTRPRTSARAGLTLLELAFSLVLLLIGISSIARLALSTTRAGTAARETELAAQAARTMLERIQADTFAQAFRSFNGAPSDDPGGSGTAPGANFAVPGLRAVPGAPGGLPGEIVFPAPAATPGVLREDIVDARLGMPGDLNGDGLIDSLDHSGDYKVLPVLVRVRWLSADSTPRSFELRTVLANY